MVTASAFVAASAVKPIIWKEADCPQCGGNRTVPVIEARDNDATENPLWFAVVRCGECSLHFTNPRPDETSIAAFYAADYRPHRKPESIRILQRRSALMSILTGKAVERRSMPWHGQGRLLDFGCGGGQFLARMDSQGWKVVGLDASPAVVASIKGKLGLAAHAGTLPHAELHPASFDVITMWASLEHVHQPSEILAEAYKLLAPGGRLYVLVPNIRGLSYSWFGADWFSLDLPRHLTHFCPATLRRMIELNGFRMLGMKGIKHPGWLARSARLAYDRGSRRPAALLRYRPLARLAAGVIQLLGRSDAILATAERPK